MAREISSTKALEPLIELGLSGSEAAVYAYLVRHSPATGYKVAKAIGKPVANTYKTIASLEDRGAIVVDDSGSRLCRAIPPAEFLARLDKRYHEQRTRATRALTEIEKSRRGDRDARVRRAGFHRRFDHGLGRLRVRFEHVGEHHAGS